MFLCLLTAWHSIVWFALIMFRLIDQRCSHLLRSERRAAVWPWWRSPKPTPPRSTRISDRPAHTSPPWRSRSLHNTQQHTLTRLTMHMITFTFMHLSDAFIQSNLHTLHSSYSFYILSALAFPGNRTHDLGVASTMLYHLSYRKALINNIKTYSTTQLHSHITRPIIHHLLVVIECDPFCIK